MKASAERLIGQISCDRLDQRMLRARRRRQNKALRILFAQRVWAVHDYQLSSTLVQTRVRLRGMGWAEKLAIFDSGSPITVVKESVVPPQCLKPYHGRGARWGQSGAMRIRGCATIEIRWTEQTTHSISALVIPDNELPEHVSLLVGNDIIARNKHAQKCDPEERIQAIRWGNDTEWVPLYSGMDDVRRLALAHMRKQRDRAALFNDRDSNAQMALTLESARLHMTCCEGHCTIREAEEYDAIALPVRVAQTTMVPPNCSRLIVGRVERTLAAETASLQQEALISAVFFPDSREDCLMWTAQFTVDTTNPDPWVPVKVCNTTPSVVWLYEGDMLGEARTNVDVMGWPEAPEPPRHAGGQTGDTIDDERLWHSWEQAAAERTSAIDRAVAGAEQEETKTDARVTDSSTASFLADMTDGSLVAGTMTAPLADSDEPETVFSTGGPGFLTGGGDADEDKERMFVKSGIVPPEQALAEFRAMIDAVQERLVHEVSPQQVARAVDTLDKNARMFIEPNRAREDNPTYPFYIKIPTIAESPVNVPPYRYPADKLAALHAWVDAQLEKGHIEYTTSAWNAPMVLARKKDGRWRFAIDLRGLNKVALFDPYPLPRIPDLLELTAGAQWFSALDLQDGYWNVLVDPDDRHKTSFTVPGRGRFQWRSMPFGYHGSGPHFQRAVKACLAGLSWGEVAVYVDDVLMFSRDFDEHVELVGTVLAKLAQGGFTVAPKKCSFFMRELPYLGHRLSQRGIEVQPELVSKIVSEMGALRTKKAVRRALGVAQFYARFIWQFASVVAPLSDATRKEVREDLGNLSEEERARLTSAAQRLQRLLLSAPTLALPDYDREFVLITDASDVGMGAVLAQEDDNGNLRPISFWSRKLSDTERRYSATEREALAIVFFVEKFRYHLLGRHFLLKTDHHALTYIFKGAASNSKLARWALRLQEFSFDIVHVPGKENVVPDDMSRRSEQDGDPIAEWNVSRQGGLYVRGPGVPDGEAIIPSSRIPLPDGANVPTVFMSGTDRKVAFDTLQRDDEEVRRIREALQGAAIGAPTTIPETRVERWTSRVAECLAKKQLRERNGVLIRVTTDRDQFGALQEAKERVFAPLSVRRLIMADAHDATWAGHFATAKTRERIARRWWWPTLEEDVDAWVRACESCAQAGKGRRKQFGLLQPIRPVLRPFERVAIDLVDVVTDRRSEYPCCLTVVDYGTRFALAIPLRDKSAATVAHALVEKMIAYFGPPEELLSDNAGDLRGIVSELTKAIGTKQLFTSTYHPRANGLVERFNQTFLGMLRTVLDEYRYTHWQRYVPMIQYAYNSSVQASLGESPHFLLYGREPHSPLEDRFEWPEGHQPTEEWIRRLLEAREKAREALEKAQSGQKRRFDEMREEPDLKKGQRVFLRVGAVPPGVNPKTYARFRGPFRVEAFEPGALVVDVSHHAEPERIIRVAVERVIVVGDEVVEELTATEREILGKYVKEGVATRERLGGGLVKGGDGEVPIIKEASVAAPDEKGKEEMFPSPLKGDGAVQADHEAAKPGKVGETRVDVGEDDLAGHYEIKTVHAHRKDGDGGLEFLVEYKVPRGAREGHWAGQRDMRADDLIAEYWDRYERREIDPVPSWRKKCHANGEDAGCRHLQCRADSWLQAMQEYMMLKHPELAAGGRDEEPDRDVVQTRSGRTAGRVRLPRKRRKGKGVASRGAM